MHSLENVGNLRVVGVRIRTDNHRAFQDIPKHWDRFFASGVMSRIPQPLSDAVYAVYTDFENEGRNNEGTYSFVIGAEVGESVPAPPDMVTVNVPRSHRAVFPVEKGHAERVGDKWREIWSTSGLAKTFVCDYERYEKDGSIHIFVGIKG